MTTPNLWLGQSIQDLPEHFHQVGDACLRQNFRFSLTQTNIEQGTIYLGVFGFKHNIDEIRAEYEQAVSIGCKRIIFLMDENHPITFRQISQGNEAQKLNKFKERLRAENDVFIFHSVANLRAQIITTLAQFRQSQHINAWQIKNVPTPPTPFIAHPYTLLQTGELIGRQDELDLLTSWITGQGSSSSEVKDVRIMNVIALGGMGKSALLWKWFNDVVPFEKPDLKGSLWWSFYEESVNFEDFITYALAYTYKPDELNEFKSENKFDRYALQRFLTEYFNRNELQDICFHLEFNYEDFPETLSILARELILYCERRNRLDDLLAYCLKERPNLNWADLISKTKSDNLQQAVNIPLHKKTEFLLNKLDQESYLLVLDGFERNLVAYEHIRIEHLASNDLDEHAANIFAGTLGISDDIDQFFTTQHRLRKIANPEAGIFFRRLAQVKASRILIGSRLYPADLQMVTGKPIGGCYEMSLQGLTDADAVNLWRAFGVTGSSEEVKPLFNSFDNYPLLIRALAVEVSRYRRAPGDFVRWKENHPEFDPYKLPLVQRKSHILEFALRYLNNSLLDTLKIIASLQLPATYDSLIELLMGEERSFATETELDMALSELEDRGLIGWNKTSNQYVVHPVVRGVVWNSISDVEKEEIFRKLQNHFGSLSLHEEKPVANPTDLTPLIELYRAMIGLGKLEEAYTIFQDYLVQPMLYDLGEVRQYIELIYRLFPKGVEKKPEQLQRHHYAGALYHIMKGHLLEGDPEKVVHLYKRLDDRYQEFKPTKDKCLMSLSFAQGLLSTGQLYEAEQAANNGLEISRTIADVSLEAESLSLVGWITTTRGVFDSSVLEQSLALCMENNIPLTEGQINVHLATRELWLKNIEAAKMYIKQAWEVIKDSQNRLIQIRVGHMFGKILMAVRKFDPAQDWFHKALKEARKINCLELELVTLISLAELHWRMNEIEIAKILFEQVQLAESENRYPLIYADAYNLLAEIKIGTGDKDSAAHDVKRAYKLAWCDGKNYSYNWGLEKAISLLNRLEIPTPQLANNVPEAEMDVSSYLTKYLEELFE